MSLIPLHAGMRVVKDPSFGTGSHPSELSGCQRGSYCGRTEGVGGKQSTRGSVLAREHPSGIFSRARPGID